MFIKWNKFIIFWNSLNFFFRFIYIFELKISVLKKYKELQESIEYNAKLTSTINFHKKEIQKLKQNNSTTISTTSSNKNNNNNKDMISIMNLQKEIQNVKKEIQLYQDIT